MGILGFNIVKGLDNLPTQKGKQEKYMETKNVVITGPVYPYKGGIAHYTGLLYKALVKKYNVAVFSFKLQYPGFLYPGNEQKDTSDSRFKTDSTRYLINTMNPFSWFITAREIVKYKPDLLVIPWWNPYFAPCFWTITVLVKLFSKSKVLYICHNVLPHEKLPLQKILAKLTLSRADSLIVHSIEDEQKLLDLLPKAKCKKHVHPTYNIFKRDDLSLAKARELLNIDNNCKVLLFFGFVREYKGLIYLIKALPEVVNSYPDVKLIIVGEFFQDKDQYLNEIVGLDLEKNINIYDGYMPDQEVGKFFVASDIVVLPYTSATQSGIVQIAYGFYKPVLVTNVGGLPEVVEHKKTGYVVDPKKPEQISDALIDYLKEDRQDEFVANIKGQEERFSWDKMVETIEELGGLSS